MKKFFSIIIILCLCGALFIPAYAEESTETTEIINEVIIPETEITLTGETPPIVIIPPLPQTVPNTPEIPEVETPDNSGVFHTPNTLNTPQGAGILLEDVSACEVNRQFITVQTRAGNVFYIIIDNDRNGQNVYFLNAVDDFDLLTFSDDFPDGVIEAYEELKEEAIAAQNTEDGEETKPTTKPADPDNSEKDPVNMNQIYIIGGVGAAFLLGLIYFKVIKPKKGRNKSVNAPSYEDEDEENEESEDF